MEGEEGVDALLDGPFQEERALRMELVESGEVEVGPLGDFVTKHGLFLRDGGGLEIIGRIEGDLDDDPEG